MAEPVEVFTVETDQGPKPVTLWKPVTPERRQQIIAEAKAKYAASVPQQLMRSAQQTFAPNAAQVGLVPAILKAHPAAQAMDLWDKAIAGPFQSIIAGAREGTIGKRAMGSLTGTAPVTGTDILKGIGVDPEAVRASLPPTIQRLQKANELGGLLSAESGAKMFTDPAVLLGLVEKIPAMLRHPTRVGGLPGASLFERKPAISSPPTAPPTQEGLFGQKIIAVPKETPPTSAPITPNVIQLPAKMPIVNEIPKKPQLLLTAPAPKPSAAPQNITTVAPGAGSRAVELQDTLTATNNRLYQEAVNEAQDVAGQGKAAYEAAFSKLYTDKLRATGQEATYAKPPGNFVNSIEMAARVEKDTGEPVTKYVHDLISGEMKASRLRNVITTEIGRPVKNNISRLRKLGISENDQSYLLNYFRTTKDGVIFDPRPVSAPGNNIPAFELGNITPQQFEASKPYMTELRKALDELSRMSPEDTGFVEGYVPRFKRVPSSTSGSLATAKNPSIYRHRVLDEAGEEVETNISKIFDSYMHKAIKESAFRDALSEAPGILLRLRARGMTGMADRLEQRAGAALGMRERGDIVRLLADDMVGKNEKDIERILSYSKPSITRQTVQSIKRVVNEAWIGLNPKLAIVAPVQPEVRAGSELGLGSIEKSRFTSLFSKEDRAAVGRNIDRLWAPSLNVLESVQAERSAAGPIARGVETALSFPGKPGSAWISMTDKYGRATIFNAARKKFAANPGQWIKRLPEGERQMVIDELRGKGIQAASETFGVLKARQFMDSFSHINKPQFLQGKLGREIPYTTFSRGVLNDVYRDILGKDYFSLGKKGAFSAASTIGLWLMAQEISGQKLDFWDKRGLWWYANPYTGSAALTSITVTPAISSMSNAFLRGGAKGAIKQGVKNVPILKAYGWLKGAPQPAKSPLPTGGVPVQGRNAVPRVLDRKPAPATPRRPRSYPQRVQ